MDTRVLAVFCTVSVCTGVLGCTQPAPPLPGRTALRTSATTARDLKGALARLPDITVQVVAPGGSSVTTLEDVQRGAVDVGIAMADVAYLAFAGQLDETPRLFDQIRGMAVLNVNTLHLLVSRQSKVMQPADLRGLHVALGPSGSATALLAKVLLEAHGVSLTQIRSELLPYDVTAERLLDGTLDAAFMTQTAPSIPVINAISGGARLVEIDGPRVEQLRTRHPFLKRALISAGTYPTQPKPVHTVGVDLVLVCRADVDDEVVYRLLDAYFAMRPGSVPSTDFERAPATPIPLHPGAARYYRQRELAR